MFRYAILVSLSCVTILDAALQRDAVSAAVTQRKARSIWPFSSGSDTSAEAAISGEHALLLEQAGLDRSFNLSSHPLWKIHKYHGIDLKPVQIETEIVKPKTVNITANATDSELPDLSFLNDLGGLADFLPDPEEDEASELIADAIKNEESSHPGFFKRLWWKIWGTPENLSASENSETEGSSFPSTFEFLSSFLGFAQGQQDAKEEGSDEDDLTIYLPETQGSYVAVVLPSEKGKGPLTPQLNTLLPSQAAPPLFRPAVGSVAQTWKSPSNHANQYRDEPDATGVSAIPTGTEQLSLPLDKPVAQWPVPGSDSQAWIQSWTPHAAYTVHVQGTSSQRQQPQSHVENDYEQVPPLPQVDDSKPEPSINLEPPAPEPDQTSFNDNSNLGELSNSWPQVLTQDVPPILEAFQQASRKSSQDSVAADEGGKALQKNEENSRKKNEANSQKINEENSQKKNEGNSQKKNEGNSQKKNEENSQKKNEDDRKDQMKDILSHFRIPEGLMKKLQVSQKDVETILNDKESAARAAERLRSLQKEFEMRKEQLSYIYATRVKKQLH